MADQKDIEKNVKSDFDSTKKINILLENFVLIANLVSIVILIFVSAISVMELAGRISAQAFVSAKMIEVRFDRSKSVGNFITSKKATDSTIPALMRPVDLIGKDAGQLSFDDYQSFADRLSYLQFAGARNSTDTIYRIQDEIQSVSAQRRNKAQIEAHKINIDRLNEASIRINGELRAYQSTKKTDLSTGDFSNMIVQAVDNEGAEIIRRLDIVTARLRSENDSKILLEEEMQKEVKYSEAPFWISILNISHLPTDLILAILVTSCGAIGALSASVRSQSGLFLRTLALGLAAGFISFLVIKGGKFIFLVQQASGSPEIPTNPYSAAFAGIIAGLFTEKVYQVLSRLIDQAGDRIVGGNEMSKKPLISDASNDETSVEKSGRLAGEGTIK